MGRTKVAVKNCIFADGEPKICVPLVGRSTEEIFDHAERILSEAHRLEAMYPGMRVDVIEFRADYYDNVADRDKLMDVMDRLRAVFEDRLLLFTYRSEEEGGELRHDWAENMLDDIWEWIIAGKQADLIDIELKSGNYRVARTAAKAHEAGMSVIMSNHNFDKTPHDEEILEMFRQMEILGADILKIASTPKVKFDVQRIMDLTKDITSGKTGADYLEHPVITISMGEDGKVSRTSGRQTGSAMTFASVDSGSAPGQLSLEEMFKALKVGE